MYNTKVLLTGCSGGGKSSLLSALAEAGFQVVLEPGRRIVSEEMQRSGEALPWVNPMAFAQRALEVARSDLMSATQHAEGVLFFDRGLIDAAVALEHAGGPSLGDTLGAERPYAKVVFVAPPWPEIFATDAERRHGLDAAIAEYWRLREALTRLGCDLRDLPKASIPDRVGFVLDELGETPP